MKNNQENIEPLKSEDEEVFAEPVQDGSRKTKSMIPLEDVSDTESEDEDTSTNDDLQYDAEARQYGYKTAEELEKEGKKVNKVKSRKEFVDFGRNYIKESLGSIKEQNSKLQAELRELVEHDKRRAEDAVKHTIQMIKQDLELAKSRKDTDAVETLTQRKIEVEQQQRQQTQQSQTSSLAQEEAEANAEFVQRNSHWYNASYPELMTEAVEIAKLVQKQHPNLSYKEASREIEFRMKVSHPEISNSLKATPTGRVSNTQSNLNKSSMESNNEGKDLRNLSREQQLEYKWVRENMSSKARESYTVNDYLNAFKNS